MYHQDKKFKYSHLTVSYFDYDINKSREWVDFFVVINKKKHWVARMDLKDKIVGYIDANRSEFAHVREMIVKKITGVYDEGERLYQQQVLEEIKNEKVLKR